EGDEVLDVCSAPGGKATLTAQLLGGNGKVVCVDRTEEKVRLIGQNARRLGLQNIEIVQCDFLRSCDKIKNRLFAKILVDVPCSNTGAWRKRPEARWLFAPSRFREITVTQKEILVKALSLLAKNGVLVYSTCSVLDIENRDIVMGAIGRDGKFELIHDNLTLQETGGSEGGYFAAIRRN
ncbi:MAG: RsmB/NOP family class I SAM-dependent RNA methyltransferase, partial [Candidatus Aureabacteria bacterium]|nr:RsmB/NOP family class I SAM-dependent RNA methyltransferase [Candidatus Auribacterota bacterium]